MEYLFHAYNEKGFTFKVQPESIQEHNDYEER